MTTKIKYPYITQESSTASESEIRSIFSGLMKLYYSNISEYHQFKNHIIDSIDINNTTNINFIALYCCIATDLEVAKKKFSEIICQLSDNWISLILSGPIGRDPNYVISIVNENKEIKNKSAVSKYLISDKCGLSISEIESLNGGKLIFPEKDNFESLKIAVMVSGQIRGAENAKRGMDRVLEGHLVDYYIDTWADNEYDITTDNLNRIYPENFKKLLLQLDSSSFEKVILALTPPRYISTQYLKEIYGDNSKINIDAPNEKFNNHQKMYFKIQSCFNLISDVGQYDLLIRIRPDLAIEYTPNFNLIDLAKKCKEHQNLIFSAYGYTNAYYGFGVDDKLAIGSPNSMEVYCNLWSEYHDNEFVIGHSTLASYLLNKKIDVSSLNNCLKTFFCNNI